MIRKPCLGCGHAVPFAELSRGRCVYCRQTTTGRGYGRDHQQARNALAATLPQPCAYCDTVIERGQPFVAAHVVDGVDSSPRVVSHGVCNERAKTGAVSISVDRRTALTRAPFGEENRDLIRVI